VRLPVVVAYVACALIWGTTYFAIRVCIGPGGYPTYFAAAARFAIAAIVLAALVAIGVARPGPKTRKDWAWLGFAGVLNFGGYALVYTAEESIPGALGAVVYGTAPLMTAILAAVTRTERPTRVAILGALVALAGIAIISRERLQVSSSQAAGVVMVLCSVVLSCAYNVVLKRHATGQHPLATNAVFLGTTALAMTLFAAVAEHRAPPWPPAFKPTLAIFYLAIVGSVIAFASYFYLLQRVRLMTSSTLVLLPPIVAMVVDRIWEPVQIAPLTYVGAAVTLLGVGLNLAFGAPAQAARAESDASG
jgi:drug/metabolite transporter (DMT)-like permease